MTKNREEEQEGKKGKKGSKYATRPFDDTRRTYILSRSRSINQKSKVRDALPPPLSLGIRSSDLNSSPSQSRARETDLIAHHLPHLSGISSGITFNSASRAHARPPFPPDPAGARNRRREIAVGEIRGESRIRTTGSGES